ncbi:MAG: hypothetical protein K2N85_04610 [Lachnospiraceae bacterium]|nr:hypothetical protein [Lachnospiraceae bacterium]
MSKSIMTYPVAVELFGKIECVQHIENDDLIMNRDYIYIGLDKYSGYELWESILTGEIYSADVI